jgi:hypothetical protein
MPANEEMELAHKSHNLTSEELTVTGGDVVAVVASDTPDDEGEVVIPKNFDLERFRKVRQVYFDHELEKHPIGSAKWTKVDGGKLLSKHFFSTSTDLARAVGDLVKEGIYKCYSVGCLKSTRKLGDPTADELKTRPEWANKKIWRGTPLMIEFSVVGQAANPDCVALAVSKKWSKSTVELLTGVTSNTKATAASITKSLMDGGMEEACASDMAEAAENCQIAISTCWQFITQFSGRIDLAGAISAASDFISTANCACDLLSKGADTAIDQCALVCAAAEKLVPLVQAAGDDWARRCAQAVTVAAECCDECLPDEDDDETEQKSFTETDIRLRIAREIEQTTKSMDRDKVIATVLKNMRR